MKPKVITITEVNGMWTVESNGSFALLTADPVLVAEQIAIELDVDMFDERYYHGFQEGFSKGREHPLGS